MIQYTKAQAEEWWAAYQASQVEDPRFAGIFPEIESKKSEYKESFFDFIMNYLMSDGCEDSDNCSTICASELCENGVVDARQIERFIIFTEHALGVDASAA